MEKSASQLSRISVEDFAEATFSSVLRAIEARPQSGRKFPFGPIIYGIIWYPEGLEGVPGQVFQPGPGMESKKQ